MSAVAGRLARALRGAAAAGGVPATVGPLTSRPWHAGLYSGEIHHAQLSAPDNATTVAWLTALPELDLTVLGHVVDAQIAAIVRRDGRLTATLHLHTIEA